jgi:hypothetical protein
LINKYQQNFNQPKRRETMSVLNINHTFTSSASSSISNVPLSLDYMFFVSGNFGGGKVALEASPDDGVSWFTVVVVSEPARLVRRLVNGEKIKITLYDNTSAPGCTAGIRQ